MRVVGVIMFRLVFVEFFWGLRWFVVVCGGLVGFWGCGGFTCLLVFWGVLVLVCCGILWFVMCLGVGWIWWYLLGCVVVCYGLLWFVRFVWGGVVGVCWGWLGFDVVVVVWVC